MNITQQLRNYSNQQKIHQRFVLQVGVLWYTLNNHGVFLNFGVPQIIYSPSRSTINHPAMGYPHLWKPPTSFLLASNDEGK